MGRSTGIAREVSEATGVNLRTVQRILAAPSPATPAERTVHRLLKCLRDTATFCRENPFPSIADLPLQDGQAERLHRDFETIEAWFATVRQTGENGEILCE